MPSADDETFERDGLRLEWASATTVGKVRRLNEDALLALGGVFVVADGMGGHAAGDVASALTIDVCREHTADLPLTLVDLERLVDAANDRVREHAIAAGTEGMGTTLVGVVLVDNGGDEMLTVVSVGDSRCYSWDAADGLVRLTHDHSVVQELVDAGSISATEADRHPERNVVTRAIGIEPAVAADYVVLPRVARQRLLLCSDGVSGQISDARLGSILEQHTDVGSVVRALLDEVLAGPATDNATAIVVDVEWAQSTLRDDAFDDEAVTGPRPVARPASHGLIDSVPIRGVPEAMSAESAPVLSEVPT